jgi:hypothetical protein
VLDGVQAKPERVRESGLGHAKSISDRFHVNFTGHLSLESFLLPSQESLNVVQAIHHPLELRFHAISSKKIAGPKANVLRFRERLNDILPPQEKLRFTFAIWPR